jgi:hypothetical protein
MSFDIFGWIHGWNLIPNIKKFISHTAVAITEAIKTATEPTGILQQLAQVIDATLKTKLAETAVAAVQAIAIKALAVELGVEGLPDNPTGDDILAFENSVFKAITGKDPFGQSKFYTSYAAQVFTIVQTALGKNHNLSFADIVLIVEESYQTWLANKAAAAGAAAADNQ